MHLDSLSFYPSFPPDNYRGGEGEKVERFNAKKLSFLLVQLYQTRSVLSHAVQLMS